MREFSSEFLGMSFVVALWFAGMLYPTAIHFAHSRFGARYDILSKRQKKNDTP
jgi:hypothetical protein